MVLTLPELEREIIGRPGLIPVDIGLAHGRIHWMDLEKYHCYQGFFHDALASYRVIGSPEPTSFISPLDVLFSLDLLSDIIAPSGFIFHAGRCGSTLLTRVLARSRSNIVFGEASPHNQIWHSVARDGAVSGTELYRRLLLSMGRRRVPSYRAHIVKFTSFNIMQFELIRAAFPDTPALFLFREPKCLIASYYRQAVPWMDRDIGIGKLWHTPESAVEDFFRAALAVQTPNFRCLNYADLKPEMLPEILRFFNIHPRPGDLRQMVSEFSWDAKSAVPRLFAPIDRGPDPAVFTGARCESLQELYTQLREQALPFWKPQR